MYLFLRRQLSPLAVGVRRHRLRGVRSDRLDDELSRTCPGRSRRCRTCSGRWSACSSAARAARGGAARGRRRVPGARRRAGDARGDARDRGRLRGARRRPVARRARRRHGRGRHRRRDCCCRRSSTCRWSSAGRASMRSTMTTARLLGVPPARAARAARCRTSSATTSIPTCARLAWMVALNSERDPFYYTMYIGVPIVLLAAVAIALRAGRGRGSGRSSIVACAVASLGSHTPVYPALQALVPPLRTFRFPVKYLSLAAFGLATLAAMTLQWLLDGDVPRRAVRIVLIAAGRGALVTYVVDRLGADRAERCRSAGSSTWRVWAKVPAPIQGAEFLLFRARPLLTSLLLKLIAGTFLLGIAASIRRERRLALAVLGRVRGGRSAARRTAASIPTIDAVDRSRSRRGSSRSRATCTSASTSAAALEGYVNVVRHRRAEVRARPSTTTRADGAALPDRPAVGVPAVRRAHARIDVVRSAAAVAARLRAHGRLVQVRVARGSAALPDARRDALRRPADAAVSGRAPLARLIGAEQLQLYDFNPGGAARLRRARRADGDRTSSGRSRGCSRRASIQSSGVLVSEPPPPPAGTPGPACCPRPPTFVEDGLNRVVIRARPAGGRLPRAARHLHAGLAGRRRRRAGAADARQRALPRRPPDARARTS